MKIEARAGDNIFVVTPDSPITHDEIESLNREVGDYINTHDKVPNLVINAAGGIPSWKDFDALSSHIRFVRDHHRLVAKVALVTDSELIRLVRPMVDVFVAAKIRRFAANELDKACQWAARKDDDIGGFEVIPGLPNDVVALAAKGEITARDYRETLEPLVAEKLKRHDRLKFLLVAGPDYESYSPAAAWDDARFGFSHFTTFSKIALVSDVDWMRAAVKLFGPIMPGEIMVFHMSEIEDAKTWIRS